MKKLKTVIKRAMRIGVPAHTDKAVSKMMADEDRSRTNMTERLIVEAVQARLVEAKK